MTTNGRRPLAVPQSLGGLRLRLTLWYGGTFFVILLLLGIALFAVITQRFDSAMDQSLREATGVLVDASHQRGPDEANRDLVIPERRLMILDSTGSPIAGPPQEAWVTALARRAVAGGSPTDSHGPEEHILRAYARPFRVQGGRLYVAMAIGDEIEVEDRYAMLIAVSGAAALAALVLVAAGGWMVARKSTAPVERAVEHMRRFMADAAHELRTPLTVVRSRAEVALQRPRDASEYEDALRSIEHETERVSRIVEDLLMLARADVGQRPIELRRMFLDDVVIDAAQAARALADRRGVRVVVDEFEESPVLGDPTLLRQLALILLDNAIKFSRVDGGQVVVGVHRSGSIAQLTIADDGIGIPPEQLPHVFERFYRGDAARTRNGNGNSEGAGLGLSIAQWIVEEHDAHIGIVSELGAGTRVTVEFPTATVDAPSSS